MSDTGGKWEVGNRVEIHRKRKKKRERERERERERKRGGKREK